MSLEQQQPQENPMVEDTYSPEHLKCLVLETVELVLYRALPDLKKFLLEDKMIDGDILKKLFMNLYSTVGQRALVHLLGLFKMSPDKEKEDYLFSIVEKLLPQLPIKEKELLVGASDRLLSFCSAYQIDHAITNDLEQLYDYLSQEKNVIYDATQRFFTYLGGLKHDPKDGVENSEKKKRQEVESN